MKRAEVEQLLQALHLRNAATPARELWSTTNTSALHQLVAFEGAEVWLYRRLQQQHIAIPDTLKSNLRSAVHRTSVGNMRIDAQTVAVVNLLSNPGIPWAFLKGQARRAAISRYPFADARSVSDVDLLVPDSHAKDAWELLRKNGFRRVEEGPVDWKADHHYPTLIDANNVGVELHTTTAMSVAPSEAWKRATERSDAVEWSGISARVPNATELVWQALSHGTADGIRGFYLKTFLSVAAILATEPDIDWTLLSARLAKDEVLDNETERPAPHERVRRFLEVAAGLAGVSIPADLRPRSRVNLVALLTWRGNVLRSSLGRAIKDRLLEESLRVEAHLPLTPTIVSLNALRNFRRRASSFVARALYLAWRATQ